MPCGYCHQPAPVLRLRMCECPYTGRRTWSLVFRCDNPACGYWFTPFEGGAKKRGQPVFGMPLGTMPVAVAQWIERAVSNCKAAGSSPARDVAPPVGTGVPS